MRFALMTVVTLTLLGCSGQPLPTAPSTPPQPPRLVNLSMMVLDNSGCIYGATVEIVRGQGLGRSATQYECGDWWYIPYGVALTGLNDGEWLTIRVSAPGYASQEISLLPNDGTWATTAPPGAIGGHAGNLLITLSKIQ
jgi:hypothetical protein